MTASATQSGLGTVADAFARSARRYGDLDWLQLLPETAAEYGVRARTWTYTQAEENITRLRAAYAAAGYGHGHRAGLLLLNRPEFLFHWIALNGLGVSVVPLNADWRAAELEYLIGHSEIALAVCIEDRVADLAKAARAVRRPLVIVDPRGAGIAPAAVPAPRRSTLPDVGSECALLYTSGTTGRPKGCVLPNEYFLWAGEWYATIGGLCEVRPGGERMITPLPMTHMNAMAYSAMCMMVTGGCLILLDRFHPRTWWRSVRESRATIVHYLGVMPAMLLGAAAQPDDLNLEVRFGFGAGVNALHHLAFEERFGFPLLEAWAMTETGAGAVIIANREPRHVGSACFGRAEAGIDVRVVDESENDVPIGEPGELLVRRAGATPRFGFFAEYLKDASATDAAWLDGWFHTGDLVRRDAAGDMRFVDRKKNVIRRSGENISAVEVESVIAQHPHVGSVGVCAVPDDVRGDEVFACIVLRNASHRDDPAVARDIVSFCLARLAYYKAPGHLAFVESLPLTPTAKIQRSELKQLGQDLLAQGRCVDLRSMKRRNA